MNSESFEKVTEASTTRRTLVKTGAKLAYAAPLIAASFTLAGGRAFADDWVWMDVIPYVDEVTAESKSDTPPGQCRVVICHATCSGAGGNTHTGYSAIEIPSDCSETPAQALEAHMSSPGHQNGCQGNRGDVFPRNVTNDKKQAECPAGDVRGISR